MSHDQYAAEAKERWGHTDAYQESQKRLSGYSKEDITKAQNAMQDATNLVLTALKKGLNAESEEAMAGAEAHRKSISDWWYECSYQIHIGLAAGYVTDPRFKAFYEKQQVGLAQYMHDAIIANAAKNS
jgi:hypothetical protein